MPFSGGRQERISIRDQWLPLPIQKTVQMGGVRWNGQSADFRAPDGTVAIFDPSPHTACPSEVLLRDDFARELMHRH